MKGFLSIPIQKQLLLIVLIVAMPAAVMIVNNAETQRLDAIADAQEDTEKLAAVISAEQNDRVAAAEQLLQTLGQLPDIRRGRAARVAKLLSDLLKFNTQYSNIFVADRSGHVWASAVPVQVAINVADRRYFKNGLATGELSSGEYTVSRFTKKEILSLAYPYRDERGNISGIVAVGFDLSYYRHLLGISELKEGKGYLLLDYRGVVLAQGRETPGFVGQVYNAKQFRKMREGSVQETVEEMGIDGRQRFITYRKLFLKSEQEPYMYVRAAIPVDLVLSAANKKLVVNLGVFTLFLCGALALSWYIGKRSIADRVNLLEAASHRMADGDLQVRAASLVSVGELGSLARSFDHLADQLKAREQEKTGLIEAALRSSERRLALHVEQTPLGVIEWNLLHKIETWNPAAESIFGYGRQEAVGSDITLVVPERLRDAEMLRWRELIAQKSGSRHIDENVTRDGKVLICEWYDTPLVDASGTVIGVTSLINNITLQKRLEAEFQAVIQTTKDGFWVSDRNGKFLDVNNAYCAMSDYSREELLTMNISDVEATENREAVQRHIEKIMREGNDTFETQHRRKDGTRVDLEVSVNYLNLGGGKFYVFLRDITARKMAEETLRSSENKYRQLHQSMRDGFCFVSMDDKIIEYNESYRIMLGYDPGELTGLTFHDLTPEQWYGIDNKFRDQVIARGYSDVFEKEYRKKDGSIIPVELRAFLIRDDSGRDIGMWALVRDITERKLAQEEKEKLFRERIEEKQRNLTEREGLLMDLHDGVGGLATNIRLLSELSQQTNDVDSMKKTLITISQLAKDAISEIRGLMQSLDSSELNWHTLVSTLRSEGASIIEPHGIRYTFAATVSASGQPGTLLSVNLYRINKEALTNVIKHARATAVTVSFDLSPDKLILCIQDDGSGLKQKVIGGRGLSIMQKRAKDIGGSVSVQGDDTGTRVFLEIPLPAGQTATNHADAYLA